ncbi:MAG: RNA polymerase sigma factor [Sedimentisphaerales bacterium]|nr:RNA polymerase sigma factor [Sedimentisphaerales bacterium]
MKDKITKEFQEFWTRTAAKVRAYMFCACDNWDDADDMTQDCCLRALNAWGQFNGRASRQAWLFGIARRTRADWFRQKRRRNVTVHPDNMDKLQKVEAEKSNINEIEKIWNVIKDLNTEQSEVIHLRFAAGLDYAQIAHTLGIPIGTVRSRLHRGLKAVKEIAGERENGT